VCFAVEISRLLISQHSWPMHSRHVLESSAKQTLPPSKVCSICPWRHNSNFDIIAVDGQQTDSFEASLKLLG
jgi:hypothetical protein